MRAGWVGISQKRCRKKGRGAVSKAGSMGMRYLNLPKVNIVRRFDFNSYCHACILIKWAGMFFLDYSSSEADNGTNKSVPILKYHLTVNGNKN